MGVKGVSVVVLLKDVDISKHVLVDFMHGTCLGFVKRIVHAWVEDKGADYYLNPTWVAEVDRRLSAIAPPTAMRRYPLHLGELANVKGMELNTTISMYT